MYTIILLTKQKGFSFLQYDNPVAAHQKFVDLSRLLGAGAIAVYSYDPNGMVIDSKVF